MPAIGLNTTVLPAFMINRTTKWPIHITPNEFPSLDAEVANEVLKLMPYRDSILQQMQPMWTVDVDTGVMTSKDGEHLGGVMSEMIQELALSVLGAALPSVCSAVLEVFWDDCLTHSISILDELHTLFSSGRPAMQTDALEVVLERMLYLIQYDQHLLRELRDGTGPTEFDDAEFDHDMIFSSTFNGGFVPGLQMETKHNDDVFAMGDTCDMPAEPSERLGLPTRETRQWLGLIREPQWKR